MIAAVVFYHGPGYFCWHETHVRVVIYAVVCWSEPSTSLPMVSNRILSSCAPTYSVGSSLQALASFLRLARPPAACCQHEGGRSDIVSMCARQAGQQYQLPTSWHRASCVCSCSLRGCCATCWCVSWVGARAVQGRCCCPLMCQLVRCC